MKDILTIPFQLYSTFVIEEKYGFNKTSPKTFIIDKLKGYLLAIILGGIILGALIAAGLAGRFSPAWRLPLRSLIAALIGGILLGYGARIAYGCNIGAFFSGVSSSSLHGWLWFVAAFIGNAAGTRLRPWFGLSNS